MLPMRQPHGRLPNPGGACPTEPVPAIPPMKSPRAFLLIAGLAAVASSSLFGLPVFYGPSAYLSAADIPAGLYTAGPTFLETFEDGTLGGGITASAGAAIPPGFVGLIDSVDADDGFIDGSGLAGHSWFYGSGATGVRFYFPTGTVAAGLVWTDGAGTITFEAFTPGGVSLGSFAYVGIPDGTHTGGTAEDRFFGVKDTAGIGSIKIKNSAGGIEVDHVQYALAPTGVPDAVNSGLLLLAALALAAAARRSTRHL